MFTGIVEEVGEVREVRAGGGRSALVVAAPGLAPEIALGDSVAVCGACLTVSSIRGDGLGFDVVPETLGKSTLGYLRRGDRVNLEGALKVGGRLSGHFVMGHVDGVGEVLRRRDEPGQLTLTFRVPPPVEPFLLEKGSVAVDGVSLTVWDVRGPEFSVALVPHTLRGTTLGEFRAGRRVNLEADVLARWVARMLGGSAGGLTAARLSEAGYDVDGKMEE